MPTQSEKAVFDNPELYCGDHSSADLSFSTIHYIVFTNKFSIFAEAATQGSQHRNTEIRSYIWWQGD